MQRLRHAYKRLHQAVTRPRTELSRAQRSFRFMFDLVRHCAGQLVEDRATQMAAALTYRTLFSLVPLVVMALLLFRGFVAAGETHAMLESQVYNFFDLDGMEVVVGEEGEEQSLQTIIGQRISEFTDRAYQIDFQSIGGVGVVLLVWAALALLVTVEGCFNTIVDTRAGRPWRLRIPIYWAVITLGPLLLSISLWAAGRFVAWGESLSLLGWFFEQGSRFAALGASWLLLFLLYILMPAARVQARAAVAGAFVAAVLWETGKWAFALYVSRALPYSAVYGSLGLVPLFLFWVYLNWLVVLFGLELTNTLQTMRGRVFEEESASRRARPDYDPRWLLPLAVEIGRGFLAGQPVPPETAARRLALAPGAVEAMAHDLEAAGYVHRVLRESREDGGEALALARPPASIPVAGLLAASGHRADPSAPAHHPLLEKLDRAFAGAIEGWTLAGAIAESEAQTTRE